MLIDNLFYWIPVVSITVYCCTIFLSHSTTWNTRSFNVLMVSINKGPLKLLQSRFVPYPFLRCQLLCRWVEWKQGALCEGVVHLASIRRSPVHIRRNEAWQRHRGQVLPIQKGNIAIPILNVSSYHRRHGGPLGVTWNAYVRWFITTQQYWSSRGTNVVIIVQC